MAPALDCARNAGAERHLGDGTDGARCAGNAELSVREPDESRSSALEGALARGGASCPAMAVDLSGEQACHRVRMRLSVCRRVPWGRFQRVLYTQFLKLQAFRNFASGCQDPENEALDKRDNLEDT